MFTKYYSSGDEMGRPCGTYGGSRGACRVLVRKPEGKRQLGKPRHRWENDIKTNL
jgi:hypothetical protein